MQHYTDQISVSTPHLSHRIHTNNGVTYQRLLSAYNKAIQLVIRLDPPSFITGACRRPCHRNRPCVAPAPFLSGDDELRSIAPGGPHGRLWVHVSVPSVITPGRRRRVYHVTPRSNPSSRQLVRSSFCILSRIWHPNRVFSASSHTPLCSFHTNMRENNHEPNRSSRTAASARFAFGSGPPLKLGVLCVHFFFFFNSL